MARQHRRKEQPAIRATKQTFYRPLRVGHHPKDIAPLIHDACNSGEASIGVGATGASERRRRGLLENGAVTKYHAPSRLELSQCGSVGEIAALGVSDRHGQHLSQFVTRGERKIGPFHANAYRSTKKMWIRIARERSRQESTLGKDLETVADTQYRATSLGELPYCRHDGALRRDRAAAKIVTVGKSAGQYYCVDTFEPHLTVPYHPCVAA